MAKAKYKRNSKGYFATNVWDGSYDESGQKRYVKLRSRKSSADLENMVAALRSQVEAGTAVRKSDMTVRAYAADWLKLKEIYTRNTQRQYGDILKYYILPVVGDVAISDLTKMHLQMIISENAAHPRTCQLIRRTFLQIAESAVDDRYLPEAALRPLKSVQLPKYQKKERRILTDQEKKAVFLADLSPMQRCFVYLLFYCGLRRGEALGMTVADFNLSRLEASVCRSVEFINNSSSIKPPKSQNGFRTVPIAPQFAEFLREQVQILSSRRKRKP